MSGRGRRRLRPLAIAASIALAVGTPLVAGPTDPVRAGDGGAVTGRVRAAQVMILLTTSSATSQVGGMVKAEARVTNLGATTLRSITVELRVDRIGLSVRDALATISQLKPGRAAIVTWSLCGAVAGSYVLLARVMVDETSIDSAARLLTVTPGRKRCA